MVSLADIRDEAERQLAAVASGEALDATTEALIGFAVRISVTSLDVEGARAFAHQAVEAGATVEQLHEVLFLISGLGVHSLFEGTRLVAQLAGDGGRDSRLDATQQELWNATVGRDRYWNGLEREVPGFLGALLRASVSGFDAFVRYCAVPWKSQQLPVLAKELISMAADATPTHRYLPGMRLHLANAIRLGAGRVAILQTLEIAAAAPRHPGVG